jgi:uncharacterized membrane protein
MVLRSSNAEAFETEFVLIPHRSLEWRAVCRLFFGFAIFFSVLSLGFSLMGAWLVAPFTGLELLALGAALYVNACGVRQREVVRLSPESVQIQRGRRGPEQEFRFHPGWARVDLQRDPRGCSPSRLFIGSHGCSVELAGALPEPERHALAQCLRTVLESMRRLPARRLLPFAGEDHTPRYLSPPPAGWAEARRAARPGVSTLFPVLPLDTDASGHSKGDVVL